MARPDERFRSRFTQAALSDQPSLSRRAFAAGLIAARQLRGEKARVFPSEIFRFADPSTEFDIYRLTSPKVSSYLPAQYQHAVARKGGFLIHASDREEKLQAFRLDLKSGESRQLTEAEALDAASITLLPGERAFCYFDGPSLRQGMTGEREIYRVPDGWERCAGFTITDDGQHAVLAEKKNGKSRLRLISLGKGAPATVLEIEGEASTPLPRPKRAQVLYRRNDELWLVNLDGQQNRRLKTETAGPALWTPSGRTIAYLHFPEEKKELTTLREHTPDENSDKLLGKTSQFVSFGANGDASVFVGASRGKASPFVLLLLRSAHREFTLCEHKSSDPAAVSPIFAPDSQSVFFQSDRDGKPAIYRVKVEKLVEETG